MPEIIESGLDLVAAANRTAQEFPDNFTLNELIEQQAHRHPLKPAALCAHDQFWRTPMITHGELNARANQVAHRLRAAGVTTGQVVGIMVERSYAMLFGIFGTLKAGGAYLPLSPQDPAERRNYVLRDANVRVLLVHGPTISQAVGLSGGRTVPPSPGSGVASGQSEGILVINLDDPVLYDGPTTDPDLLHGPEDLAYVIYTSGSTGRPKGVMVEHRSVVNRLDWMQRAYPINGGDVLLQKTPFCFDVSVWELFWWAIEGATLALLPPGDEKVPHALLEAIRMRQVTVVHFVPSMLSVFLEALESRPTRVEKNLGSLRRVFASGEALSPVHARKFREVIGAKAGCKLINLYGPTEATVDATCFECPTDRDPDVIPIGRPIQNMRAYVVRDEALMPPGEPGELCLAGVGLARGYLNNSQLTDERFTTSAAIPGERIYRTGDLARWLPDGNLEYLGREDGQVKIRGLRIELGEIENTIRTFPGVADAVVVVQRHSESVVLLKAHYVAPTSVSVDALRQHLQDSLPAYMVPSQFAQIAAVPLTSSGKADRKALANG